MITLDEFENVSLRAPVRARTWSARSLLGKMTSPRKVLAAIGTGITLLTIARILVLFIESYSSVSAERNADHELMALCENGHGAGSADLRALCMRKRAERSAPILLKALLRACATAFTDFCESMSSPTKVVLLVLFAITGIAAPVVKAVAALFVDHLKSRRRRKQHYSDSESDEEEHHEIVVMGADVPMTRSQSMSAGLRRTSRRLGLRRSYSQSAPRLVLDED